MSASVKVDIFTDKMRTEFATAYEATAKPAAWESFTTKVNSSARIEHYTWMSPSPGLAQYQGHRRYGKIESLRYSVENKEFDASFEVLLRDIEDDQTGGYDMKPRELAERAKAFPGRWVLKTLALGKSTACFDGSSFIANSHSIGSGDNLLAYNGGANDAATYKLVALFHGSQLKPLIWQDRKPPQFKTTSGSIQSDEAKVVRYWIDMEGECAYGYWWNAVWVDITDTPTVAEAHEILGNITNAFRTFQLPKSLSSEDGEYIHEQTVFNTDNLTLVGSTGLEPVMRQALRQEWIPQTVGGTTVATTNLYNGFANFVPSAFLN